MDISSGIKKVKNKIFQKINQTFFADIVDKRFSSGIKRTMKEHFNLYSISEWLPYQYFNPETEIFEMERARGVMLEATPMVGASEDNAEALYSLLQRILPEGTIVQFLLYASPHLGEELDDFISEREGAHPFFKKNAEDRVKYLKKGVHQTLIPGQEAVLRDYRLLITLVFDNQLTISESKIMSLRHSLLGTLKGMGVAAKTLGPDEMMTWVDCLLRPNSKLQPQKFRWNELQCIASQLAAPHQSHFLTSQRIGVNDGEWEMRNYRVNDFPTEPVHLYEMADLIGSQFDNNTRIGCPFSLSLIIKICNQKEEKRMAQIRAPRAAQRAAMIGKFSPKAIEEAQQAREIVKLLENFERLVVVDFQATLYYQRGTGDIHETNLMNVFQGGSKKWLLLRNNMLQMVSLIAHLPLAQSHLSFKEMKSLGMTQKVWAMNAANMAPIIAEMKGMDSHRLMISGRRGQVLYWDPFGNQRGNYNTCVAGISGSGKSFTVQEIAASLVSTGARVWIIDVGRSYKKLCNIIDGQFVEFNKEANICLNPFSTVNPEEIEEFYAFMTPLISLMANPEKQSTALQTSLIEQSIREVWKTKGKNGGLGDVADWLLAHHDSRARDIGESLYSYTPKGQSGSYFNGEANINFNNSMVVFELEEINNCKRLQSIIFMLLMYHVTEKMYLSGRQTQMALIIDEAWDMLKGGHGGDIIESISRRARKYKGCLITITQSISDYFSSPAGKAAYANSYWKILHLQNKANISDVIDKKQLSLDPFQERLLRSVTTEHGQYSEMMIQGDSGEYAVGRLMLDPYSRILYSTQAQDYAAVNQLCSQGLPLEEAIGLVAQHVFPNEYNA
jgi:conjugal transfer ATP-binding protein TraC